MKTHLEYPHYYLKSEVVKEGLKSLFEKMRSNKERKIIEFDGGAFLSKKKIIFDTIEELGFEYMEIKTMETFEFYLEKPTIVHVLGVEKNQREAVLNLLSTKKNLNGYFLFTSDSSSTTFHLFA